MDTAADFIRPEFLNILFFQQKNLVVFPYVDLRHLHALEIFTVGYNVVDLETTALHNLKEILEFEVTNSYSQNPTLYFIYNVDREKVKELMNLDGIRCIINSNENVSTLANGSSFIFFNKKNNQFLNYDLIDYDLEFEKDLISNSENEEILQEKIQKIKIAAIRIFKELNQQGNLENIPQILADYKRKYWTFILQFTGRYYDINIPDIKCIKFKPQITIKDYSREYEILVSTNRHIGKEFIQLLHEYRSKRVNPSHLELDELYNPQKLYNYLRNHHWKEKIPQDFIVEWTQMKISNYHLTDEDIIDFEGIFEKMNIYQDLSLSLISKPIPRIETSTIKKSFEIVPFPSKEWNKFKQWLLIRIDKIEFLLNNITPKTQLYLINEITKIKRILPQDY